MNRNWNEQVSRAQRALDNACDCCDHGPRNAAPEPVERDYFAPGRFTEMRRTPEDRDMAIVRDAFGPLFEQMFGDVADLHAERVARNRAASEARHEARRTDPPEAA